MGLKRQLKACPAWPALFENEFASVGARNLPHGLCGQYFVGQFDGIQFVNDNPPDLTLWADHGMDFYAAQSWSDVPAAVIPAWLVIARADVPVATSAWMRRFAVAPFASEPTFQMPVPFVYVPWLGVLLL